MPTPVLDQLEFNLFTSPTPAPKTEKKAPLAHEWIVAAEVRVEKKIAKIADFRGSFTTTEGTRVDALEVYCRACRRPYEDVADIDCAALVDNRHLIGGDQSVRAKRKIPTPPPNSTLLPGGTIQRRGIHAYVAGVSRPR